MPGGEVDRLLFGSVSTNLLASDCFLTLVRLLGRRPKI